MTLSSSLPLVFGAASLALLGVWPSPGSASAPPTEAHSGGLTATPDTLPSTEELARRFGPEGDRAAGLEGIRLHIAQRSSEGATLWLQLLATVDRIDARLAPAAVRAVALGEEGMGVQGAELISETLDDADCEDRPPLLALAALLSEEDDPEIAAALRGRLLKEHSDAFEVPETRFRQARWLLAQEERREEGLDLLETLIVEGPNHPVAPEARRLFQQERNRPTPSEPEEDPS